MTARQLSKLGMYNLVLRFFQDAAAILAPVPALAAAVNLFQQQLRRIDAAAGRQAMGTRGVAKHKQQAANRLIEAALTAAHAVYVWAGNMGDLTLQQAMYTTPWRLSRLRDNVLAATCANFYEEAERHLAHLAPYGIDTATLANFKGALTAYADAIAMPRNATAAVSALTIELKQLFKATDLLLQQQLDPLMRNLKAQHPDTEALYFLNRKLIDPKRTVTQLKVLVKDAAGLPLPGATVTVVETAREALTNRQGLAHFKPLRPGLYTLRVVADGFAPVVVEEFKAVMGKVNRVGVVAGAKDQGQRGTHIE